VQRSCHGGGGMGRHSNVAGRVRSKRHDADKSWTAKKLSRYAANRVRGRPYTSSSRRTLKLSRTRPGPARRQSRSHLVRDQGPRSSSQEPPPVLSLLVPVLSLHRKSPGLKPLLTKVRVYALKVSSSINSIKFFG
jgi:hypothetical protein